MGQIEGKTPKDMRLINSLLGEITDQHQKLNDDSKFVSNTDNSRLELMEEAKLDEDKYDRLKNNIRKFI